MRVGTLIRNKYSKERIGIVIRFNERYGSYTIYWIDTGEVSATYRGDTEVLCEERNS
mgnify:FL=1